MKRFVRDPFTWLTLGFTVAWFAVWGYTDAMGLLSFQDASQPLASDASQYEAAARSLVMTGSFSLDGVTPFFEREPGYSVFLAAVYAVFGVGAYDAVFVVQALLHLAAAYTFVRSVARFLPARGATLLFGLLLFAPPVFHALFALYRESLALSLAMFLTAALFRLERTRAWDAAVSSGLLLGALLLVDAPFLLFPLGLAALLLWWRVPWTRVLLCLVLAAGVVAPWVARNYAHVGMACFTGCYRSAIQWHVRGEQAEYIGIGLEPLRCLAAEYVTRDWSTISPFCSFNAVWHRRWPDGFVGVPEDAVIAREGQAKILAHLPNYLWFSLFEIVEFHLPYVNGWGRTYNLAAVAWTAIAYLGCLLAVPFLRRKEYLLFAAFILYLTALYALTDATPRYAVPILHCYAFLAALGYTGLQRLWPRSAS